MSITTGKISLQEANDLVRNLHRHHKPVVGHKFSIGLYDYFDLRGAAIVGRPVSRHLDDGCTLEITRCATDGVKNGCSKLYGACRKMALSKGYSQIVTYTSIFESGSSLEAAGFRSGLAGQVRLRHQRGWLLEPPLTTPPELWQHAAKGAVDRDH